MECNLQKGSVIFAMDIFAIIKELILKKLYSRENLREAALNMQIWEGLMNDIMIHKRYFLGLVSLSPGI